MLPRRQVGPGLLGSESGIAVEVAFGFFLVVCEVLDGPGIDTKLLVPKVIPNALDTESDCDPDRDSDFTSVYSGSTIPARMLDG